MKISIVIPLGRGSRWNDTELRYALRSVEKHLKGYGEVFIVGECPSWLQNIIHIPATDGDKIYEKERNIFNKIILACQDERVTEEFLFMNDDHFLLKDYEAARLPFYVDGMMSDHVTRTDPYYQTAINTVCYQADSFYFDVHCPILYKKQQFTEIVSRPDWTKKWGYCIKSLYGASVANSSTTENCPDLKIREPLPAKKIKELIAGRPWFSMDNAARDGGIESVLQELYPLKSQYEK